MSSRDQRLVPLSVDEICVLAEGLDQTMGWVELMGAKCSHPRLRPPVAGAAGCYPGPAMRYEHLIEINSQGFSAIPPFTREELWRGLLVRVYEPESFPVGPDDSEWKEESPGRLNRIVRFGRLEIHDSVTLEPMQRIVFDAQAREDMAAMRLTITLEEPAPGAMVLRFVYENDTAISAAEAPYEDLRHGAWLENDRDMVRTLRAWRDQGRLGAHGTH
ncbi:MAG: DUF1857 family protein [Aquabacterium sp.]|nr:MAG: DUF1857 family protein [Aquabacterium sp.]